MAVIDLTDSPVYTQNWTVVASQSGGPIGTWPKPPAETPVSIKLLSYAQKGEVLYFSIELDNKRSVDLSIPVSTNPRLFAGSNTIKFQELMIDLGSKLSDAHRIIFEPNIEQVNLYGSTAVQGTTRNLAPSESLVLRLKTTVKGEYRDGSTLRAQITGADIFLSREGQGYSEKRSWLPALSAVSTPVNSVDVSP